MTTEIQQTRYDQLLRRVGGLIGPGSKVSEVISELFPMIDVERIPGELMLLGGTRLCVGAVTRTGTATFRPRVQLFNPVDSGVLITCSSFIVDSNTRQRIRWNTDNTQQPTGTGFQRFRDRRLGLTALPTGGIFSDALVAIVNSDGQVLLEQDHHTTIEDPNGIAVLPPGSGLAVGGDVVNSSIGVTFYWRERSAEQSELNF